MYSIEDINDMCTFDTNDLSYMELEKKYKNLSNTLMCISDSTQSTFANEKDTLKDACMKLLEAINKVNLLLDYYDLVGQGRRNFV